MTTEQSAEIAKFSKAGAINECAVLESLEREIAFYRSRLWLGVFSCCGLSVLILLCGLMSGVSSVTSGRILLSGLHCSIAMVCLLSWHSLVNRLSVLRASRIRLFSAAGFSDILISPGDGKGISASKCYLLLECVLTLFGIIHEWC